MAAGGQWAAPPAPIKGAARQSAGPPRRRGDVTGGAFMAGYNSGPGAEGAGRRPGPGLVLLTVLCKGAAPRAGAGPG